MLHQAHSNFWQQWHLSPPSAYLSNLYPSTPTEEKQQAGQGEKQQEFRKQIKEKGNKYKRADYLQLLAPAFIQTPEWIYPLDTEEKKVAKTSGCTKEVHFVILTSHSVC